MSAGRRFRRQIGQAIWRKPGVEPSAETRAQVGKLLRAHDDDEVGLVEFYEMAQECARYMSGLPEAERVEAASQITDHSLENVLGRRVRTVGFGRPEAS